MPKVSVILPNYNHAAFLEQRIESILNQTFQDFELILLDDASTDNSKEILDKYCEHPRVTSCIFNEVNSGSPFGMWEMGFKLVRGELVWIAESDDWCEEHFLERLISSFENESVAIAHCKSYDVNTFTSVTKKNIWWDSFKTPLWNSDFVKNGIYLLMNYGKYKCPVINVSSAIIRKNALINIKIPIDYKYCGDWFFWAQLFEIGDVSYCSTPLNYIRIHNASATGEINSNTLEKIQENIKVASYISNMINEKFKYESNYEWIVNFLLKETFRNKNLLKYEYIFPAIPWSFKKVYYKKVFFKILLKLKNKIYTR
jgi:glycosyltransferase involved in cell wall biosynthesis